MLAVLAGAVVFLVLMAGLFVPLEGAFSPTATRPTARAMALGAGLFLVNSALMSALGAPLLEAVTTLAAAAAPRTPGRAALVFVLSDLVGYALHRAMHRLPWLWRVHALHHEATETSWLDAWRQHPVDFLLHGVAVGLPGAVLGASLSDLASVVVLRKAFTTFLHASLPVDFGLLLASPAFHRRHHAANPRLHDTCFAGTFPLWDWLFGTLPSPAVLSADVTAMAVTPRGRAARMEA